MGGASQGWEGPLSTAVGVPPPPPCARRAQKHEARPAECLPGCGVETMSWLFWEEDETCYAPTAPFIHWVGPVHQQDIKYSLQDTPNIRISLSLSPLLSLSLISLPYSLSYIIYRFLSLPLISSTCLPLSLSLSLCMTQGSSSHIRSQL